MIMFLHEKGYTYFTIPNLTYFEINRLVDSVNRKNKKEEREHKKMERQSKRKSGRYR